MADIADVLGGAIVPDDVKDADGFEPLPAGWYPVEIDAGASIRKTKAGTGQVIRLEMTVLGDKYSGRKLFHNLNIVNPNQTAVEIGIRELAQLGKALGLTSISDCSELQGGQVMAKIKVDPGDAAKGYDPGNSVVAFKALVAPAMGEEEPVPEKASGTAAPGKPAAKTAQKAPASKKRPWEK